MHVIEGLLVCCDHLAYVFESSSIAVLFFVSDGNEGVGKVEVVFHKEADVDGSDGEEKVPLVVFHFLNQFAVPFDESEDELERQDSSSPKVGFGMLALEPEFEPLFSGGFNWFAEVLEVEILE